MEVQGLERGLDEFPALSDGLFPRSLVKLDSHCLEVFERSLDVADVECSLERALQHWSGPCCHQSFPTASAQPGWSV